MEKLNKAKYKGQKTIAEIVHKQLWEEGNSKPKLTNNPQTLQNQDGRGCLTWMAFVLPVWGSEFCPQNSLGMVGTCNPSPG